MDIMLILCRTTFGITVTMLTLYSFDATSRSIFDITIALQPKECSSFINHVNHSITDPTIVYPPATSDRINYEYEITTPNYPRNYPTNLQCITLIKAPNFDYKIVIEIREKFELEPAKDCFSDFLEISDGPYGFSNRIGKFCDSENMPKEISSSGPFLWLRFFSDSDLPHTGFKIVYRYIKQLEVPQIHYCYRKIDIPVDESFNLNRSVLLSEIKNISKSFNDSGIPVDCVFDFYVDPGFNLFIYKSKFSKKKFLLSCTESFIEIYHRNTIAQESIPRKMSNYFKICIEKDFNYRFFPESYRTSIRISNKYISKINNFRFLLIPFKKYTGKCPESFSSCQSKYCIPNKFICKEDNCLLDIEEKCIRDVQRVKKKKYSNSTKESVTAKKSSDDQLEKYKENRAHVIILSSITVILILSMVVCLVITIHSKKMDLKKNEANQGQADSNNTSHNNRLYYEPIMIALSQDKLNKSDTENKTIWSKRRISNDVMSSGKRKDETILKLNGGISADAPITAFSHKSPKVNTEKLINSSMNKIGKYLSVPNPSKSANPQTTLNTHQLNNQNQSLGLMSSFDEFQSMSSQSCSKQTYGNDKYIHQTKHRASSMGSDSRKQLLEPAKDDQYDKNIEWYCGPVIRSSSIESSTRNDSSDMLNTYSAKSSSHVPGCRSLPNVNYIGSQIQVCYTDLVPNDIVNNDTTDSLDFSSENNSSYKEEMISTKNHYVKDNLIKLKSDRNGNNFSSHYGFKYFCPHKPSRNKDFIEYIA